MGGGLRDCKDCGLNMCYRIGIEALMDVSGQVTSCGSPILLPVPTRTGCPVSPQVPCLMSGRPTSLPVPMIGSYRDY